MKPQAASLPFTPIFTALVAIIKTKLPQVGDSEFVLTWIISQFKKSFTKQITRLVLVFFFVIFLFAYYYYLYFRY